MSWLFWRQSPETTRPDPPSGSKISEETPSTSACPVDHKTRAIWLSQHSQQHAPHPLPPQPSLASAPTSACSSDTISQAPVPTTGLSSTTPASNHRSLSLEREVSSIPRAFPTIGSRQNANNEDSNTHDGSTGNWIYPSERQFFDAMRRKNFSPSATDMPAIIPIHNAVNERAWHLIKSWEKDVSKACGGPKLYSFKGLGTDGWNMSPKARWNSLLGYQTPFDRHDWVVERCGGGQVEYVIDFYQGRGSARGQGLNFYLDVRPKLNSWAGCKMRARKAFGFD